MTVSNLVKMQGKCYNNLNLKGGFMIIVIEGTDGSGKATQTKLLNESLQKLGYKTKVISFPNYASNSSAPVKMYLGGELGDSADCLNAYQASSLFAVDRLLTMKLVDIAEYDYIILDRYTPSNMIHQACKIADTNARVSCLDWLNDFEYNKLSLPKPDKILFLDLPTEISLKLAHNRKDLKNGQKQDIHENDTAYMQKAYDCAKFVAHKYDWEVIKCYEGDQILPIETIHEKILEALNIPCNKTSNL